MKHNEHTWKAASLRHCHISRVRALWGYIRAVFQSPWLALRLARLSDGGAP